MDGWYCGSITRDCMNIHGVKNCVPQHHLKPMWWYHLSTISQGYKGGRVGSSSHLQLYSEFHGLPGLYENLKQENRIYFITFYYFIYIQQCKASRGIICIKSYKARETISEISHAILL